MIRCNLKPEEIIDKAGELAEKYNKMGFHCSEAVIRAVPEALGIALPADVIRAACGFFGGAGGTGGRCGALESGIMLTSWLYGRMHPLQGADEVKSRVAKLVGQFETEFASTECRVIKPMILEKYGQEAVCIRVYRDAARLITRLLMEEEQ